MATAVKQQSEVTARGLEILVSMHRVLDTRLAILETQVGEVLSELRSQARHIDEVIAELRAHTHEAA